MPETDYLKIPQNRIGALIGNKGDVKKSIEKATETILDIDSEDGTVYITPQERPTWRMECKSHCKSSSSWI